jgi:nucleotide-binding universal stress UspA family protein
VTTILYATRGGTENQDAVIALAHEQGADLLFLYVSNVRFLDHFASPVPVDLIQGELDEMGEFLLAIAQEKAEGAGVKADILVRHGSFWETLQEVIADYDITTVVLGHPNRETGTTTAEYIDSVAQSLLDEYQVEVITIDQGEIVAWLRLPKAEENGLS